MQLEKETTRAVFITLRFLLAASTVNAALLIFGVMWYKNNVPTDVRER